MSSSAIIESAAEKSVAPNGDQQETHRHRSEYERMLDEKGRVTIPPRVRGDLGNSFVTARGVDGSVLVIPADMWPEIEARLDAALDAHDRYLQFAIHNRSQTSLDRQGRLKLPRHLLEWALLSPGDAVSIVVDGARFEVWNRKAWLRHQELAGKRALEVTELGDVKG